MYNYRYLIEICLCTPPYGGIAAPFGCGLVT